jgi:hypothetical protein
MARSFNAQYVHLYFRPHRTELTSYKAPTKKGLGVLRPMDDTTIEDIMLPAHHALKQIGEEEKLAIFQLLPSHHQQSIFRREEPGHGALQPSDRSTEAQGCPRREASQPAVDRQRA